MSEHARHDSSLGEARAVAAYLTSIRALVNEASASRAAWIRQLGQLMKDVRVSGDNPGPAAAEALRVGIEQMAIFRAFRERLDKLTPPGICQDCHLIVLGWLDKQTAACDVMIEVGHSSDLPGLRAT